MILVLVPRDITKARVVAQNQRGAELTSQWISLDLLSAKELPGGIKSASESGLQPYDDYPSHFPDCKTPLGDGLNTIGLGHVEFSLSSTRDLEELSCIFRGIIFTQHIRTPNKDHAFLHALILLFFLTYGDATLVWKQTGLNESRRCLQFHDNHPSSILYAVKKLAIELCTNPEKQPGQPSPRTTRFSWGPTAYRPDIFEWGYSVVGEFALRGGIMEVLQGLEFDPALGM
jgi:hypothetical protein